ncbi:MAG: hypothetical protein IJV65_01250 [Kiritimatiellae bacterium]|nr:hypothetical protein [Kiritimatiellia bacterium]
MPAASDGGTRRSAPVGQPDAAAEATSAWARPEAAYVPPAGAVRPHPAKKRGAGEILAGIGAKLLAFVLVARPPMVVRVAGSVLCVALFLLFLRMRVAGLESVPAANPRDPSSIKAVAPRPGKALPAPRPVAVKPIAAAIAAAPRPAPAAPAEPAAPVAAEPAPAAVPDAAPVAQTPPQPAEPEAAKRLPVTLYEDALFQIVQDMRRKPWADAKASGIRALKDVARKVPDKAAECQAVEAALGMADSWEDLVGATLYDHPRKREITVGRNKHTIVPTATMPGVLICDRIVNGMTLRNQKLDLTKMPNREKWAIVKAERPSAEPAALYSRAFLALAFGSEKDFRALVDRYRPLESMKAFYLVYELDRK